MNIIVQQPNNLCWMCETPGRKLTTHHVIPQHLNSKNNVIIPVCTVCHKKLNQSDVSSMLSYAYKLEQLGTQVRNGANRLHGTVESFILEKSKPLNKKE